MFIDLSDPSFITYGKINSSKQIIAPNTSVFQILNINNPNNIINPIVKTMLNKFISDYNKASVSGKIVKDNTLLYPLRITEAGSNAYVAYENYINRLFDVFITNYRVAKDPEQLITFENVLIEFVKFLTEIKQVPYTFSSYIVSNQNSLNATGLSFKFFEESLLRSDITQDPNYNLYVNTLFNNGFAIDENNRGRVFLNLGSSAVLSELNKAGITNINQFYSTYYIESNTIDILFLSSLICKKYNEFCKNNPYAKPRRLCTTGFTQQTIPRVLIDFKNLYSKYNLLYWLKIYLYLRSIETYKDWSQQDFDFYLNSLENVYYSNLDKSYDNGLKYVNNLIGKYPYPQSLEPIKFYYEPRL